MNIYLHANATTTPKTRRYIQASTHSVTPLADELSVSEVMTSDNVGKSRIQPLPAEAGRLGR